MLYHTFFTSLEGARTPLLLLLQALFQLGLLLHRDQPGLPLLAEGLGQQVGQLGQALNRRRHILVLLDPLELLKELFALLDVAQFLHGLGVVLDFVEGEDPHRGVADLRHGLAGLLVGLAVGHRLRLVLGHQVLGILQ